MNLGVHWEWTGNQPFSWKTQNPAICCPCISKYSGALIDGQPSHLTLYLPRPCFLLDNPKWQEHVNEGSESTLLLAHVPSLGSHLEQDHWGTPRDAQQVVDPYVLRLSRSGHKGGPFTSWRIPGLLASICSGCNAWRMAGLGRTPAVVSA